MIRRSLMSMTFGKIFSREQWCAGVTRVRSWVEVVCRGMLGAGRQSPGSWRSGAMFLGTKMVSYGARVGGGGR